MSARIIIVVFLQTVLLQILAGQTVSPKDNYQISGKVIDKSNDSPLEFSTISVYSADSNLVTGGLAGPDGAFAIKVGPGHYYAIVQFISYEKITIPNIIVSDEKRSYKTGIIELSPEATALDEVTVTAEKSEMVIHLDKKIFNVGKDLSNTGKSALDILDNIPSIAVDLDGNVSLRGSENLQILVDGKPSGMVSAGNTDALRNLQGTMIERVEVITNPSARYEAEGMAGIINIVLKKDQQKGINGSFEGTAGYPHEYSLGANVNFRKEKINYFLNYNIRYNERPGTGNSYQYFNLPDTAYITRVDRSRNRTGLSNRLRGGFDYLINSKNTLTAAFLLGISDEPTISNIWYYDYTVSEVPLSTSHRRDEEHEDELDMEFSLNYTKLFRNEDHKFTALIQYIKDAETEKSEITEELITEGGQIFQNSLNKESERNLLLQADYIYPFGNKGQFETGYRSEFRNIANPFYVEETNEAGNPVRIPEFSNNIDYFENVHALYAQGGNAFGWFTFLLGLRMEISDVRTYFDNAEDGSNRLYTDFFPTLHTTFQINESNSVQLSYSRRINRPHFWLLNPFYSYSDDRNIRTGNPNLQPEYTHSLEAGYLLKNPSFDFYTGFFYRHTSGVIERIADLDTATGIIYVIPVNLSERQSYGLEANVSVDVFKWWTLTGDLNFFQSSTYGRLDTIILESEDYSWHTRMNSKIKLPYNIDFQTIFFYRAPQETTQGKRLAFYMLNMALSKDILKGKGTLTLNVRDVLNSRRFKYIIDQSDLYSENEHRRAGRIFTLTFIYRLNQKKRAGRSARNGEDFGGEEMGF
ncbi:MAG: TonB-dependent receptor [Bacteroidales bacterium]|nr:TonB-dependent receptor [Bacteroidales bacterium]